MNKRRFRIFIHKTSQHFYAQLIDKDGSIKISCSTLFLKNNMKKNGEKININFINSKFVKEVASKFANSLKSLSVDSVEAFNNSFYDRGKKKYCGLVKLFAESLRENGILI
jgi:large subunit ribosomal protein L18